MLKLIVNIHIEQNDITLAKLASWLVATSAKVDSSGHLLWIQVEMKDYDESSLDDPRIVSEVWRYARAFISTLNGVIKLTDGVNQSIKFKNLEWFDGKDERKWMPIGAVVDIENSMSKVEMCISLDENSSSVFASSYSQGALLVQLSIGLPMVAQAFRLFNQDLDWVNLYRIFEVIKADMNGEAKIVQSRLTTHAQLNSFRASANHPDVSGDLSRHAVSSGSVPTSTMSLTQAQRFIKTLLTRWLNTKSLESTT